MSVRERTKRSCRPSCTHNVDMFEDFQLENLDVGEVRVRVRYAGDGPAVLLVHGHPRTHATWYAVAPALVQAGFSVVCPDLRGYGDSSTPPDRPDHSQASKREMAVDLLALTTMLGLLASTPSVTIGAATSSSDSPSTILGASTAWSSLGPSTRLSGRSTLGLRMQPMLCITMDGVRPMNLVRRHSRSYFAHVHPTSSFAGMVLMTISAETSHLAARSHPRSCHSSWPGACASVSTASRHPVLIASFSRRVGGSSRSGRELISTATCRSRHSAKTASASNSDSGRPRPTTIRPVQ